MPTTDIDDEDRWYVSKKMGSDNDDCRGRRSNIIVAIAPGGSLTVSYNPQTD
ncbi:hypothetical protein ACFPLB_00755 [Aquamicrobium segne]|uniref:Uncharacterized protein n=1 Tax=Aquamicrobium segne TaxID=469547 RepID=A0ABW0GUB7_9HYPH